MKYTIISRDEFLKVIKFGTIYQSINYIADEKNQQKVISEILKSLPYDDSFGYVVIEFTYEESFSIPYMQTLVKLDIKDIINIYCLSTEALDFYKTKFNPKIKFKLFENQELIKKVDSYKLIEDKKKGIEVLFDIFKLNLKDLNEKFNAEYIGELLNYKKNNYLEQEYKNFYFDLFCYERKNSFFKEDIGFIADIRAISKMQDIRRNKEVFLSGNYPNLSSEKDRESLKSTFKTLVTDSIDKVNKSDKKTDEEKDEIIRNLVVGVIFLKSQKLLNTESREQNYWESFINFVNAFKKEFLEETKEALWYLGVFLGYKYLYDEYYNFLDLNIFKEEAKFGDSLTNEQEQESELVKLKHDNEELSKKITQQESDIQNIGANSKLDSDNTQDINTFDQSSSLNLPKEEIEPKKVIDNENTDADTTTEKEVHVQKDDSNQLSEFDGKADEKITESNLSHLQDPKKPTTKKKSKSSQRTDSTKDPLPSSDDK